MSESGRVFQFYLFRLVLEPKGGQTSLSDVEVSKADLLAKILRQGLEARVRQDVTCLSSKVYDIGIGGLYFQFGEIHKKRSKDFDKDTKEFIDTIKDDTDCVHCLYDIKRQLLAIEKKSGLPSPKSLANRIGASIDAIKSNSKQNKIFSDIELILLASTKCKARQIYEPNAFVESLKHCYKIVSYRIDMVPQNPIDFKDTIKDPLGRIMDDTGANAASIQVKNSQDGLGAERLVNISHDVAAYGAGAEARVIDKENAPARQIKLNKNENAAFASASLPITAMTIDFVQHAEVIMDQILRKFNRIANKK